ncbi:MAG: hypothetical protein OEV78_03220 [Spirochaetia bacterium]|nr:hypothetical protein [Spirochaetia bacterium]
MEILRNKIFHLSTGVLLILLSTVTYFYINKSDWSISVKGIESITQNEIISYVRFYLKENPDKISSSEIKKILEFHPRIQSAEVKIHLKSINISIIEKHTAFLLHNDHFISEITSNGQILQEMIVEKNHLSENLPIFYLTAEKDNEMSTIKSDIIRLWEATKNSHAFIWERLSEIVLKRDDMENPEIDFFHSYLPVKITMYNKFDVYEFRKLWAILYLMETENYSKKATIRIYQDHGVIE